MSNYETGLALLQASQAMGQSAAGVRSEMEKIDRQIEEIFAEIAKKREDADTGDMDALKELMDYISARMSEIVELMSGYSELGDAHQGLVQAAAGLAGQAGTLMGAQ